MNVSDRIAGLAGKAGADEVADWLESGWVAIPAQNWTSVVDSGNPVSCLVGGDGRLLYVSRAAERWKLVGDAAQARGMSLHDLLHPGCSEAGCGFAGIGAEIAAALQSAKPLIREIEDARLDRHLRLVVMPVVVMPLQCGLGTAPNAAVVSLHDLTPQKRTEAWLRESAEELGQELKKRTAALEQAVEAQQKAETGLRRSESEFRLVSAALMTMQEIERKRIATELHDSVGQSLSALGFGVGVALDAARSGDARMACEMLEKLAPQVKETVTEVRRIAMDLRPATLDDLGIVGTLSWFFREFRAIHPGLDLQTDVTLYEEEVSPALRTTIFRVVQEALNNVVKHARARVVRVRLWRTDRDIRLEVADDGHGFAAVDNALAPVAGSGMGLKGMRDRVEFAGGTFHLDSDADKGTRVSASWPIRAE